MAFGVNMSDHWETFPCAMGEHTAWISYDHGIREEINALPFANVAKFKVPLHSPDDRGLPQDDEFDCLIRIEDKLKSQIESVGGCEVGRITTNGARYFFFYTGADEEQSDAIARRIAVDSGYKILLAYEADPERKTYWTELFPTDDDWRVIQDLRVEQALRDKGDSLDQPRPIQHWAYFKTLDDRQQFISLVGPRFESVREFEAPGSNTGAFAVTLSHSGLPDYRSMNAFTVSVARYARECGGDYDGWEAQVCKS
ncbi:MAG: DUF695 domain-containing protein [Burkholderiales bacterium]